MQLECSYSIFMFSWLGYLVQYIYIYNVIVLVMYFPKEKGNKITNKISLHRD